MTRRGFLGILFGAAAAGIAAKVPKGDGLSGELPPPGMTALERRKTGGRIALMTDSARAQDALARSKPPVLSTNVVTDQRSFIKIAHFTRPKG